MEANSHRGLCGVDNAGPDIGFLAVGAEGVMVAVEGEKSGELHPAVTELFVGVVVEAAGVDAEHGDAEEGEGEGLRDGEEHV